METESNIVRKKSAIIADLTKRMNERNFSFGKTALQKEIYLLQEIYNVPCGYKFDLYTYGPFCSELLSDLDYVEAMGGVNVNHQGIAGYKIECGENNDAIRSMDVAFLREYNQQINKMIEDFGKFSAKVLELRSTIIFCDRNAEELNKEKFINIVKAIKPKFSQDEILQALKELESYHFIKER